MEIFELLETLEDIIERGRNLPFSSKGIVDKDEILDLIKEIRLKLPDELLAHTEDVLTQTLGGLEKNISEALKLMEMSIEDTLKTVQNSRKELK